MSRWDVVGDTEDGRLERRVRDEVRDGVAVAAASVGASVLFVLAATLLMKLAG